MRKKEELQKHNNFLNGQLEAFIKAEFDKVFAKNKANKGEHDRRSTILMDNVKLYFKGNPDLNQLFLSHILDEHGEF